MTRDGKIIQSDGYPIRNLKFWISKPEFLYMDMDMDMDLIFRPEMILDMDMDFIYTDPKPDLKSETRFEPDLNPNAERKSDIYIILYFTILLVKFKK
jgi:hypothetical protein